MPLAFASASANPSWSMAANWNRIFGGAVVNDLLVGYSDNDSLSDELDLARARQAEQPAGHRRRRRPCAG